MPLLTANERIGTEVGGRYRIHKLIAEGGFAAVFEAEHLLTGRAVALKLVHPHLVSTEQIGQRFLQEAQAMAKLRHPGIVEVVDASREPDGTVWLALELLHGETLEEVLARSGRLTLPEAVQVTTEVLDALAVVHALGIVHRDIKPANIFLARDHDRRARAKLLDFGIAHIATRDGSRLTHTGMILGTPEYMSPEQGRGNAMGPPADLWSVGIMLWELLTGDPPWLGDSAPAILMKSAFDPLPDIRARRPDLPDEVVAVIERSLEKNPADRYAGAGEMRAALLDALHGTGGDDFASLASLPRPASARGESGGGGGSSTLIGTVGPAADAARASSSSATGAVDPQHAQGRSPRGATVGSGASTPRSRTAAGTAGASPPPGRGATRANRMVEFDADESGVSLDLDTSDRSGRWAAAPPGDTAASTPSVAPRGPQSMRPAASVPPTAGAAPASAIARSSLGPSAARADAPLPPAPTAGPGATPPAAPAMPAPFTAPQAPAPFAPPPVDRSGASARFTVATPPAPAGAAQRLPLAVGVAVLAVALGGGALFFLRGGGAARDPAAGARADAESGATAPLVTHERDAVAAARPVASPGVVRELRTRYAIPPPVGLDADGLASFARHFALGPAAPRGGRRTIATCARGVVYLYNSGDGLPITSHEAPIACDHRDLAVVPDLDGDGQDDVAAVTRARDGVAVLVSSALRVERTVPVPHAVGLVGGLAVAGEPAVVVYAEPTGAGGATELVAVGVRTGQVHWRAPARAPLLRLGHPSEVGLAVGPDADGDGAPDVVAGAQPPADAPADSLPARPRCVELVSGATGARVWREPFCQRRGGSQSASLGPDLDGDARGDVAVGTDVTRGGDARVVLLSGGQNARLIRRIEAPAGPTGAGFGWPVFLGPDMNGDGAPELAVGSVSSTGTFVSVVSSRDGAVVAAGGVPGALGFPNLNAIIADGLVAGGTAALLLAAPEDGVHVYMVGDAPAAL